MRKRRAPGVHSARGVIRRAATAAMFLAPLLASCDDDAVRREFLSAATDGLESGVRAILGGVIDGTFAAIDIAAGDGSAGPSGEVASSGQSTSP